MLWNFKHSATLHITLQLRIALHNSWSFAFTTHNVTCNLCITYHHELQHFIGDSHRPFTYAIMWFKQFYQTQHFLHHFGCNFAVTWKPNKNNFKQIKSHCNVSPICFCFQTLCIFRKIVFKTKQEIFKKQLLIKQYIFAILHSHQASI